MATALPSPLTVATGAIWHIAMNPHRLLCGCSDWLQWDQRAKAWTQRTYLCQRHESEH
jgi:hypothetical protein